MSGNPRRNATEGRENAAEVGRRRSPSRPRLRTQRARGRTSLDFLSRLRRLRRPCDAAGGDEGASRTSSARAVATTRASAPGKRETSPGGRRDERSSTPRRNAETRGMGPSRGRTMMCACRRGSGSDGSRLSGSPRSARARPRTVWDGKMLKNERARQLQQSHSIVQMRTGDDSDQTRKHRSKSTLISPVVIDQ